MTFPAGPPLPEALMAFLLGHPPGCRCPVAVAASVVLARPVLTRLDPGVYVDLFGVSEAEYAWAAAWSRFV